MNMPSSYAILVTVDGNRTSVVANGLHERIVNVVDLPYASDRKSLRCA
jgi:hypothetical protein